MKCTPSTHVNMQHACMHTLKHSITIRKCTKHTTQRLKMSIQTHKHTHTRARAHTHMQTLQVKLVVYTITHLRYKYICINSCYHSGYTHTVVPRLKDHLWGPVILNWSLKQMAFDKGEFCIEHSSFVTAKAGLTKGWSFKCCTTVCIYIYIYMKLN